MNPTNDQNSVSLSTEIVESVVLPMFYYSGRFSGLLALMSLVNLLGIELLGGAPHLLSLGLSPTTITSITAMPYIAAVSIAGALGSVLVLKGYEMMKPTSCVGSKA